ncbi:bifunctional diguanylate cyclase/phosphodiesterase [Aliiglaciecola lipolytica]|uniref:Diguanylate cyclase/phosphodiesterase n=1 Tax=Aliiglaciecola lipolytica E3 TaxID=1127673 RepID=K6YZV0_9ALTE|nr:EAL domain-containing protein [Aliiglaciecola lipolytica]GAC16740.1 diguanylate cyclase/phosphodiesterase [Aliiglaciecola lipolytica E3]
MSAKSLNQHVFRLSSGLVLLCAIAILVNVWISTIDQAKQQLANNLKVAESVFKQVLETRESQLFNSADVLTSDYGFKAAIGSQDSPTIDSVLVNHGNRISADLMALISLSGSVRNSTSGNLIPGSDFPYPQLIEQAVVEGGASEILLIDDKLYQALLLRVRVPGAPALAMVGFEINNNLLSLTKSITQLDATIQVKRNDQSMFQASTLSTQALNSSVMLENEDISWIDLSFMPDHQYISKSFLLEQSQQDQIWVMMSEDSQRLFGEFNQLQIKVTVIALLSVLLALLFGALVSRKLSRPLGKLSFVAHKIAAGNYEQSIDVSSNTREIDELATSFQTMQDNIRERQKQISYQASHDMLTDLQNRYQIRDVITDKFAANQSFQVIGANILGFRGINDIFGYQNGDYCLQTVASRFKQLGGESARLNGGEFLWIPASPIALDELREIQKRIEQPVTIDDVVMNIKLAIGVLSCPDNCENTENVFKRLNISLDEARTSVGLLVKYHEDFEKRYARRLAIISELKHALVSAQSELKMVYQPKLELKAGKVTHAEALIRWNSSTLGFVPPDEFIGIAEQAGLIGQVTDFVIKTAIIDAKRIVESGLDICIAINLSAKDILNPKLLSVIEQHLKHYQVDASRLSFEITESDLVADPKKAVDELNRFREMGFSLAIDDFGTGYSSLAYLKQLPVSELKIDKSFVLKLAEQSSDQQIVQTILELAHNFQLGVIAEGVENQQSLKLLKEWGCDWVQGYHVCRPIDVEDMIQWCLQNAQTNWFE